jgi:hypothetical protein
MKKFLIAEAEKSRILGMHYKAMGKSLVNEQNLKPEELQKAGIQQYVPVTASEAKLGNYYVSFTENTNFKRYNYQCAPNPKFGNEPWNKTGAIYDGANKLVNDPFVLSNTPEFKKIMADACRAVFTHIAQQKAKNAPQPQVAAATTAKVTAPNPNSDAQSAADAQKRAEASKAKRDQANIDLKTLMSSPSGFLKYTDSNGELITDKTTLDTQAKELSRVLTNGAVIEDRIDKQDLIRSMRNLVRNFPEYGESPYFFNSYITQLIG